MMKYEFERIAGYSVSDDDYIDIIEPMYNATKLDKDDFIKCLDRKRFEIKVQKSQERIELEEEIEFKIQGLKGEIKFLNDLIDSKKHLLEFEDDEKWIKVWKSDIKQYREAIKATKKTILELMWVLE